MRQEMIRIGNTYVGIKKRKKLSLQAGESQWAQIKLQFITYKMDQEKFYSLPSPYPFSCLKKI